MLRLKHGLLYFITLLVIIGLYYFMAFHQPVNKAPSNLQIIGDQCIGISERAVANINPIIEFQRLELLSRKSHTLQSCMEDHGFYQNPAWLNYAKPVAANLAQAHQISEDEALENLKREEMLIFSDRANLPIYWAIKSKK